MAAGKDLTGARFGRLLVTHRLENDGSARVWLTKCDCGSTKAVRARALLCGETKSCGCLRRETSAQTGRDTGRRNGYCAGGVVRRWYSIWSGMMKRCYNPHAHAYDRYGGRGIAVCERWHQPENFLSDMGEPPEGTSIDRINGDGHYEPGNCRWASAKTQGSNRRGVRYIEFNGTRDHLSGWAKRIGINVASMMERVQKWPIERALTQPRRAMRPYSGSKVNSQGKSPSPIRGPRRQSR